MADYTTTIVEMQMPEKTSFSGFDWTCELHPETSVISFGEKGQYTDLCSLCIRDALLAIGVKRAVRE